MKILLTVPQGGTKTRHFPPDRLERLRRIGEVTENPYDRQYTRGELKALLPEYDVVLTHWSSAQYDEELLDCAPNLKILAHCAGTVAHIASEACYDRGIRVLSANPVMATYVAEATLGMMITAMRRELPYDQMMREGRWESVLYPNMSLLDAKVGLIGLGTVGRNLLDMLHPFACEVTVYDPYLPEGALDPWPHAKQGTLEEALRSDVVSVHAAQTPETYHMINRETLAMMPDHALLVNTSRGSLIDEAALIPELESGRLIAALDVYEHEHVPQSERLLACKNVLLQPHRAGFPVGPRMTDAILTDLERFARGEPLQMTVSHAQYMHMTQE